MDTVLWIHLGVIVLICVGSPFLLLLGSGTRGMTGPGPAVDYAPGEGPNDRCRDPGDP